MPATYELIATTTLGSAAASITFSSIAGTYTDLRLVAVATSASGTCFASLKVNGLGGSNYSNTYLVGNGSTATSGQNTSGADANLSINTSLSTTIPSFFTVDLFNYAGSTNKTFLSTTSNDLNGSGEVARTVSLCRTTSAITSVTLQGSANFAIGTTATIYGIKNA